MLPRGAWNQARAFGALKILWPLDDSTPEGEYQETVNKSKAMLKAIAMAESFIR
jgi:hypothetical protein